MKNKITKILLLAVVAILIFGTVAPAAYESYDTYTYSIDGEPLKSPAAYTPDFTAYDSQSMGLLSGNNWKYDAKGNVAVWAGEMTPETVGISFTTDGVTFVWDDATSSYVAEKYAVSLVKALALCKNAETKLSELAAAHPLTETSLEVTLSLSDLAGLTLDNAEALIASVVETKVADAKAAASDPATATVHLLIEAAITETLRGLAAEHPEAALTGYILIPETYDDGVHGEAPVTKIAEGFLAADGDFATQSEKDSAVAKYESINTILIGKNVTEIGKDAFANSGLKTVYYEANSEKWAKINIDGSNKLLTTATVFYYSETIKYGNTQLNLANDVTSDYEGNLYIADTGNNRIVVLNKRDYKAIGVIGSFYNSENGKIDSFDAPTGIYVTDPNKMVDGSCHIFVCDSNNRRILVFDRDYNHVRTIESPESALISEEQFKPYAVAVDIYGRIFVVSRSCYEGVIVLSGAGEFTGFIGAQKVTQDVLSEIWDRFQSAEDREDDVKNLSIPFNNITVDDYGFVYVTINFTDPSDKSQQLSSIRSKTATYSPVKKLNSMGVEIMKRNGFFDPGGEVAVRTPDLVSNIIDIAIGNEGSWTILDTATLPDSSSRSRTFTYDQNGNLLFAFGEGGGQIGNGTKYYAMCYQVVDGEYRLVLLDYARTGFQLTVYHPTEYYDKIMSALHNENVHNYSETINDWQEVLTSNNNFDLAYIGIGKALYNQGKYEEAMDMLSKAYETEYYSKAFAAVRKEVLSVWLLPVIILLVVALVFFFKFLGWAKKKNKAVSLKVGPKTYGEEMLYVFHLIFHPFDGFWDLKHEKRGSVRAASTILGITVVSFFYQAIGQGYMFNPRNNYSSVVMQVISVAIPVLLWVVANWCLTTLFEGEGSLKDIYIATCYSLAPLPLFIIVSTILTNVFTATEGSMVSMLVTIGYIWVGILLFFGMVVTHDYTTGKNVITTLGTIVAMAVIMFIAILFSSLVMKMATFLVSIVTEIASRF